MISTEVLTEKSKLTWPVKLCLFILVLELSTILTMAINDVSEVDATIKSKISQLVKIENIGNLQSVQVNRYGPLTFYKYKFFAQQNHQVSAKATQFFGFSPQVTCVSGSPSFRCHN